MDKEWFYEWYDSLSSRKQAEVDNLADDMGLPLYDDCEDYELAQLHDCAISNPIESGCNVKSSYDPTEADTYVVKIWYEVEPEYDAPNGPQAAEEVFYEVATSPQEAIEYAKRQWAGPIDRIEIIDVNPEEDDLVLYDIEDAYDIEGGCSIKANDFLSDEDKEILRKADTSEWADMQHERTENAIRKAGGYANWIKKEKDSRKKNNVSCASGISDKAYIRGLLADYLDDGTLSKKQYDDALNVRYNIAGDDLSIIIEAGYLDAVDQLKSIRYMTEDAINAFNEDNDTQYDGAYVFRYKDGTIEYYGFFAGDDDLYFMGSKE